MNAVPQPQTADLVPTKGMSLTPDEFERIALADPDDCGRCGAAAHPVRHRYA
jgi:hypothetical protein